MITQPVPALSKRELQILQGMSNGRTNRQIGTDIGITRDTVSSLARRLFRKIVAIDRAHAVRRGYELGILTTAQHPAPSLDESPVAVDWAVQALQEARKRHRPLSDRHIAACMAARSCPCKQGSTWRWPEPKAVPA